jgi:hypothetical protein
MIFTFSRPTILTQSKSPSQLLLVLVRLPVELTGKGVRVGADPTVHEFTPFLFWARREVQALSREPKNEA